MKNFGFEHLQQAEALRYLEQFIRVLRAGGALSEALTEVLHELDRCRQEAALAFRQANGASQTTRMQELERERDRLVSGLGNLCDGFRNDPDPPARAAGDALGNNLKLYGGAAAIIRQTVSAETTTITSILRDWTTKPELVAAVGTLNLARWTSRLQVVNSEYDTLSVARNQERATQEATVDYTVKDKLTEARPLYNEAIMLLEAGHASARRTGGDTGTWLSAIGAADAITEEYAALLAGRATRSAAKAAAGSEATNT